MIKFHVLEQATQRYWDKVDKDGPIHPYKPSLGKCWLWTGAKGAGYGRYQAGVSGLVLAHRFALAARDGCDIRRDELCLHTCDVRACVNPDHLYWGSYSDNNYDSIRRSGRRVGYRARDTCFRGHPNDGNPCRECWRIRGVIKNIRRSLTRGDTYSPRRSTLDLLARNNLTLEDCMDMARRDFK